MEIKKPIYHPDIAKLAKPDRGDCPIAQREKENIRRVLAGEQVQTKEESMTRLGLHRRWGP